MQSFTEKEIDFSKGVRGFLDQCGLLISLEDDEEMTSFEKEEIKKRIEEAKEYYHTTYARYRKKKYEQNNRVLKISLSKTKTRLGDTVYNEQGEKFRKSEEEFYLEKSGDVPMSQFLKEVLNGYYDSSKYHYVVPNRAEIQKWISILVGEIQRIRNEAENFTFILNRVKKFNEATRESHLEEYKMIARSIAKIAMLENTIEQIEKSCLEPKEKTVDFMGRVLNENPELLLTIFKHNPNILDFVKQTICNDSQDTGI